MKEVKEREYCRARVEKAKVKVEERKKEKEKRTRRGIERHRAGGASQNGTCERFAVGFLFLVPD